MTNLSHMESAVISAIEAERRRCCDVGMRALRCVVLPTVAIAAALGMFASDASFAESAIGSTVSGMIGYWAFDEGEGDTAANVLRDNTDIFGNSGGARLLAPVWARGKYGKALDFSGGRTAVLVDKTKELDCHEQVTIAAWVKLKNPKTRGMIVNYGYAYRLCVNQSGKNRVRFQLSINGRWAQNWLVGKRSLDTGKWRHVAGVYDGEERRIYINGELDAAEAISGAIGNGRQFLIGGQTVKRQQKRIFKFGESPEYAVMNPFPGLIDEVKVWNRALSPEEVATVARESRTKVVSLLPKEKSLYFYTVRCVSMLGEARPYEIAVFNSAGSPYAGTVQVTVSDSKGSLVYQKERDVTVGPRQKSVIEIPFRAKSPGAFTLAVSLQGRELFKAPVCVLAPMERQPVGELSLNKVLDIDLTEDLGADALCDDGASRVVRSAIGRYREAGAKKFSRFVARLPLRRRGLHLVRVTYPDDKERTCEIASWSPVAADRFNAHTGYFTGGDFPISGRFHTFDFVMWARDVRQALVFMTWLDGQPAAASRIEVFEVNGRLPARPASRAPNRRFVGHYWEDAQPLSRCFGGDAPDLLDFDRVVVNLCDYFDYTGQNLLMHPVVWYEGPIYNSLVEVRGGKGGFHLPTEGWIDILLERFEERGFKFYGTFNVHQLPSLVKTMNADDAKISAGEPTFNAVSKDNEASIKTWHHRAPMFNALHPRVQERVLALVEELADRYSRSPAFAGIGFHLTIAQLLQPGSLDVSYDDWTVGEFEKDTGMKAPIGQNDPKRFSKRHAWITQNARDEWIRWRCERMAEYYGKVARILRSRREDLKLVVTILEPPMSIIDPQRLAWLNGTRLVELSRQAGIDPALLAKHPGIVIQQRLGPTAKRKRLTFGVTRGRWGCPPPTPQNIEAIRQMDLNAEQQRKFRTTEEFGVFLYNRYFETAIGRIKPLKSEWYESIPWRASAVAPAHDHFMEYYAQAMAMFDPTFIAIGGFTNGTVGHEVQVERFARVFRLLPVGTWRDITGLGDDMVGRTIQLAGKRYIYVVNKSYQEKRILLRRTQNMKPIGGSPQPVPAGGGLAVKLGPYQLAAWVTDRE